MEPKRIAAFDGIRAVAVAGVFASHAGLPHTAGGKTGVIVFFVLSGFLITGILVRELGNSARVRFGRFYWRRFLRLGPAMLAATAAYVALAVLVPSATGADDTLQATPSAVFYYLNWRNIVLDGNGAGMLAHYWSLAVEEQFYILWPLILIAAYAVAKLRGVAIAALAGVAISLAEKYVFYADSVRQTGTDISADALLAGCALAILVHKLPAIGARLAAVITALSIVALAGAFFVGNSSGSATVAENMLYERVWWPLAVAASVALIAVAVRADLPRPVRAVLEWRPVVYLGRISYGFYLWHIFALVGLSAIWPTTGAASIVRIGLSFAFAVTIAAVSYELMEKHIIRWGRSTTEAGPRRTGLTSTPELG